MVKFKNIKVALCAIVLQLIAGCAAMPGNGPDSTSVINNAETAARTTTATLGYLNAFETGSEMRAGIGKWLTYYNSERPHSTHGILTPDEAYVSKTEPVRLAA
mgnify:CR=1 FL=1